MSDGKCMEVTIGVVMRRSEAEKYVDFDDYDDENEAYEEACANKYSEGWGSSARVLGDA